jgi:hypothetical protein
MRGMTAVLGSIGKKTSRNHIKDRKGMKGSLILRKKPFLEGMIKWFP